MRRRPFAQLLGVTAESKLDDNGGGSDGGINGSSKSPTNRTTTTITEDTIAQCPNRPASERIIAFRIRGGGCRSLEIWLQLPPPQEGDRPGGTPTMSG